MSQSKPRTSTSRVFALLTNVVPQTLQKQRNALAIILIVLSLCCLYPGLTQAMMNLSVSANLPLVGSIELYNKTQSILQAIDSLFRSDNHLVAVLILLFSVIIPLLKASLLILVLSWAQWSWRQGVRTFINKIAKWSMADVFVVSIFMAFLAGQANPAINAVLHNGFWWFTAYCILSILAGQIMSIPICVPDANQSEEHENVTTHEKRFDHNDGAL